MDTHYLLRIWISWIRLCSTNSWFIETVMQLAATTTLIQWNPYYGVNQIYTKTNYCTTDHCKDLVQREEESSDWWAATEKGGGGQCIWFLFYLWINKTEEIWVKVCKQRHCCLNPKKVRSQQLPQFKRHQKTTSAMSYNALLVNSQLVQCAHCILSTQ